MKKVLTCVECPMGCTLEVTINEDGTCHVQGNTCPRGKIYGENEVVCPKRVLTTSVRLENGEMLPVITDAPVKKSEMLDLMKIINELHPAAPIKIGDVLLEKIDGEANLVATGNSKR